MFLYGLPDIQYGVHSIQESRMSSKTPLRTLLRHNKNLLIQCTWNQVYVAEILKTAFLMLIHVINDVQIHLYSIQE